MLRRHLLLSTSAAALFATQALARFPRGAAGGGGGGSNTLTVATIPAQGLTTGVNGVARASNVTMGWTGVAPSGVTHIWSGGGGTATVSGFVAIGSYISYYASNPTSAGTYGFTATGTGANTASATASGIVISTAPTDFATGIAGPATVVQGQAAYGTSLGNGLGGYLVRGNIGPVAWSLTDTTGGSGDAANFGIGGQGQLGAVGQLTAKTSYSITVNATDQVGNVQTLAVTVQNPISTTPTFTISNNTVPDSITSSSPGYSTFYSAYIACSVAFWGVSSCTFSDPSGLFTWRPGDNLITIPLASLIAANFGTHNVTLTPNVGSPQTFPLNIGHDAVQLAWRPKNIYSSTPPTNGYGGMSLTDCNQIGTLISSADSGVSNYALTSNPTGALNIYSVDLGFSGNPSFGRSGFAFLLSSVSAGTLNGTCQVTSGSGGINGSMVLTLPVPVGTVAPSSDVTITPVSGLTNWQPTAVAWPQGPSSPDVTFTGLTISGTALTFSSAVGTPARGMILYGSGFGVQQYTTLISGSGTSWTVNISQSVGPVTGVTAKMPVTVANVSVTGFTPNWALTTIDVADDNCQLIKGPSNLGTYLIYNPRYAIYGSGTTAFVTAWNLNAINETTPQVDTVTLTLTDGNGTYCQKTFTVSTAWVGGSSPPVTTVGPGGTFASPAAFQTALWNAPATYVGNKIRFLRGCPDTWNTAVPQLPFTSQGFWPGPLIFEGDETTQASFTGTITGISTSNGVTTGTLAVSGVTGTIVSPDFILIAGVAAGIIVTSGSGSTWTVTGPGVAAMSGIAMTTQMQQIFFSAFTDNQSKGGIHRGGGWDLICRRLEMGDLSNGNNAGAFYIDNQQSGNLTLEYCYARNSDNGVLNGDYGVRVWVDRCLFAGNGNDGHSHNIYIDNVASFSLTNSLSIDSLCQEFKSRAMNATITGNSFVEGVNWFGSGVPFQNTQGGIWTVSGNLFVKGTNLGSTSNNGNIVETYNECAEFEGEVGTAAHEAWAVNSFIFDSNAIVNTYAAGSTEAVIGIGQVGGNNVANVDPIRNIPYGYTITDTGFYNLSSGQWSVGTLGGVAPALGSGNVTLATFPFTAGAGVNLINPLTKAPPIRAPQPHWSWIAASPAASNTLSPYVTVMTVPTGSGSGTNVVGGLVAGYDINRTEMTAISGSISVGGSQFSLAVTTPTAQIETVGALADDIYFPQVTISGTGTAPLPGPQYFPVIVGAGGTVPADGFGPGIYVQTQVTSLNKDVTAGTPLGSGFTRHTSGGTWTYSVANTGGGSPWLSVSVDSATSLTSNFTYSLTSAGAALAVGGPYTTVITATDGSTSYPATITLNMLASGVNVATAGGNTLAATTTPAVAPNAPVLKTYTNPTYATTGLTPLPDNLFSTYTRFFGGPNERELSGQAYIDTVPTPTGAFFVVGFSRPENAPSNGIVSGFGDNTFRDNGLILLSQFYPGSNPPGVPSYQFEWVAGGGFDYTAFGGETWTVPSGTSQYVINQWSAFAAIYNPPANSNLTYWTDGVFAINQATGTWPSPGSDPLSLVFGSFGDRSPGAGAGDNHAMGGGFRDIAVIGPFTAPHAPTNSELTSFRSLILSGSSTISAATAVWPGSVWATWDMTTDPASSLTVPDTSGNGRALTIVDNSGVIAGHHVPYLASYNVPYIADGFGPGGSNLFALVSLGGGVYAIKTAPGIVPSAYYGQYDNVKIVSNGFEQWLTLFIKDGS